MSMIPLSIINLSPEKSMGRPFPSAAMMYTVRSYGHYICLLLALSLCNDYSTTI